VSPISFIVTFIVTSVTCVAMSPYNVYLASNCPHVGMFVGPYIH